MSVGDRQRSARVLLVAAWIVAVLACTAVLAAHELPLGVTVSARLADAASVGLITAYTVAIGHRIGSEAALVYGLFAAVVTTVAVLTTSDILLGGIGVLGSVAAGLLAVLVTRPAATAPAAIREVVFAAIVAVPMTLATEHLRGESDPQRLRGLALIVGVFAGIALVSRLGAGWHGLGKRGLMMMFAAAVVLVVVGVYSETVTRYGASSLVTAVDDMKSFLRDHLGAVPHPVEVLVGYPALLWGVLTRSRRRQGWWACALGTVATVSVASALVDSHIRFHTAALAGGYSLVLGILLGLVVVAVDRRLSRGRFGADEPLRPLRPEPGRFARLR